jgi:hypothetical protein
MFKQQKVLQFTRTSKEFVILLKVYCLLFISSNRSTGSTSKM